MKIFKIILIVILIGAFSLGVYFGCLPSEGKRVVAQNTYFSFDTLNSNVKGIPVVLFLNGAESGITLRKNGTATIKLVVYDILGGMIGGLDLGTGIGTTSVFDMLYEYLPGLDFNDLHTVVKTFKGGLGITLLGVDPDDEELQAVFSYAAQNNRFPNQVSLPKGFGLEINGRYYIKDITSPVTNVTYTGVFMGNPHPDGESFLILELRQDEQGKQQVIMDYPLIDIYLIGDKI